MLKKAAKLNDRPVIGVVAKVDPYSDAWHYHLTVEEIRLAVMHSGGIARGILSPQLRPKFQYQDEIDSTELTIEEHNILVSELAEVDGVILQGGTTSNAYEEVAAEICLDRDIPILGICAGFNNLIRALGGHVHSITHNREALTLHQQQIYQPGDNRHYTLKPDAHRVAVQSGTILSGFLDSVFYVNSDHTYVAYPEDLRRSKVSALCTLDGTVEAFEVANQTFAMGIKWHPELMPEMRPIFHNFINACRG